ncbi:MAG: glycosyltransferase [Candidatus Omnitrophica bacterium]|nr:glycosyltransferase [Candidatus Omnitrophota bacterium]
MSERDVWQDIKEYPKISIINPIRNVERTIEKNLDTLLEIDYPKERMEIIFADGGSTDKSVEIIKSYQKTYSCIKLVVIPNCKSPGQARNAALGVAEGEYILFTDGDCAPLTDWAKKIIEPFLRDGAIGMVGGEILTLRTDPENVVETYCEETGFLKVAGRCALYEAGYYPTIEKHLPHEVNGNIYSPFFATANAAVSKKAVDTIGRRFWDEITSEDVDFSLRILKAGFKLYFQPSAIVNHMHRVTLDAYRRQLYGYGFGHPLAVLKHAKKVLEVRPQYFGYFSIPIPFPIKGIIYIGDFHFMHLFGLGFLLSLLFGWTASTSLIMMLGFAFFTWKYFKPMRRLRPQNKFLTWCKIRYLSNWSLMLGGFKGAKTFGVVYVESSW